MKPSMIIKLITLAAIWGSSYLLMKLIVPAVGLSLTLGARILLGAAGIILLALFIGQAPEWKRFWKKYLLLGAFNLVIPSLFIVYSIVHLNASMSAILNATTPLFTMLVARVWLKETLTYNKILGIVFGVMGLTILVGWNPLPMKLNTVLAFGGSLLAALSYGVATVYSRIHFAGTHPVRTTSGQLLGASILVLPLVAFNYKPFPMTSDILVPMFFLGLLSTAVGFILYFHLIAKAGSVNTSMVTILVPVFSLFWTSVFLREPVSSGMILGLAFIIIGLYLVMIYKPKPVIPQVMQPVRTFSRNGEVMKGIQNIKIEM